MKVIKKKYLLFWDCIALNAEPWKPPTSFFLANRTLPLGENEALPVLAKAVSV